MVFFTLATVFRIASLQMVLLLFVVQCAYASDTLQSECGIATGFVSSLQKQRAGDAARLARLRNKIATLGIQRFTGAVHSFRDFTIKLPLGGTVVPFARNATGLRFDGLNATSESAGVSLYDVDYGVAVVAVIPGEQDVLQWERFLTTTVRSPEDILFREPDGVIYYDYNSNSLVALYHQYKAITGVHVVGRSVVSGAACMARLSDSRTSVGHLKDGNVKRSAVPRASDTAVECGGKNTQPCRMAPKVVASVGSGLSAESDMPHNSATIIASASIASANAHSRCRSRQPRPGGFKEILRIYSQLRTLNPQYRDASDTFAKAYSINNYGVKDAYIVWNDKKEGGVLLTDGTVVVPPKYCSLYVDNFGYVVTDDHGVGILDFSGNTILPCKYTLFTLNDDGLLKVGKQTSSSETMSYGVYDLQKRTWVEPIEM